MSRSIQLGIVACLILLVINACNTVKPSVDPLAEVKRLVESGDAQGGLTLLEQTMIEIPDRLEYSNYYRILAVQNKEFERSINYFKDRIENSKAPNEMYYNLAFAYIDKIPTVGPMGAGFLSKRAIAQFQVVIDKYPNDWVATYGVGMNYLHWPDYFKKNDSATVYLEKSMELQKDKKLEPYFILTYLRLGDAYAKTGETEKAYKVWNDGLKYFPDHPDLVDRVNISKSKIGKAMRDLYNPNNSIGKINTDISVLWAETVPDAVVPLSENPLKQAGVGGLLKASSANPSKGQIGLFSWFMRNLPFLSDKDNFANVDMSSLGIDQSGSNSNLASIVAHGMITGFLSQFENESPQEAKTRADKLDAFHKPFFHEGLGMGYAATASLDDVSELKELVRVLKDIDPRFTRLHLAGAGMWFGLEASGSLDKVKNAFRYLGDFGEAYAYEGYGFAKTLFYLKRNPEILQTGKSLGPTSAKSFYHGAGRALWILYGKDLASYHKQLQGVPESFRSDAYSGYGMGVAFTKVEDPEFVFSYLDELTEQNLKLDLFLTGVTMGYVIRNMGEPKYVENIMTSASDINRCRIGKAIQTGENALSSVNSGTGDLHADWRNQIHDNLVNDNAMSEWKTCI